MAQNRPNRDSGTTSDVEREDIRSSNDHNQQSEREGVETGHNRGYDEAVTGRGSNDQQDEEFEDVDPDSAEAGVDRDDTIDEI